MNEPINTIDKKIVFIQYDVPPLKSGEYTVTVSQEVKKQESAPFTASRRFAVTGERFSFDPADLNTVFPQNLANGEFSGILPHVVFNRRTLPWERTCVDGELSAPWLIVLLFNENELPLITKASAKDLVPAGTQIAVADAPTKEAGTMPKGYFSYPGFSNLDYGETPDDECNIIDLPSALFNTLVPSKDDLPYLAHIREVMTIDKEDQQAERDEYYAVVLGNRIPLDNATSYAMLVSVENMGSYLPGPDSSSQLPAGTDFVRLICYNSWSFTVNEADQTLRKLLENLNKDSQGNQGLTNLGFPFAGTAPTSAQVQVALTQQATGQLDEAGAGVLVLNAFTMGYSPYNHYMRHGGNMVSWYRGPLSPYGIIETLEFPLSCSDAANRYNPETGMFDVSYGAAWQLGQLLALQNKGYAAALYNWKKGQDALVALQEEQRIIEDKYGKLTIFGGIFLKRRSMLADAEPLPELIIQWLARLSLLNGVPFNYLVPDERMLPPESMRVFYLDNNWIDALLDGAFSIGRSATAEVQKDAGRTMMLKPAALRTARRFRRRKASLMAFENSTGIVTGFLLRSAVLRGWPGLEVNGYSDDAGKHELPKLRMERLSDEVMICLFDGRLQMVALHEPPEALHCGMEQVNSDYVTSLRVIKGTDPGSEIIDHTAPITLRGDKQTMQVKQTAGNILAVLNAPPLSEDVDQFTSAEFALEMIKGVVKVEFLNQPNSNPTI